MATTSLLKPSLLKPSPEAPKKFQIRDFFIIVLIGLIVLTIVSIFISQFTDLATIKAGKAFLILFIAIFISLIWWAGYDKKLEANEVLIIILVAIGLIVAFWALNHYIPEIFSIFPHSTKQLLSVINP